jgi:CheY-like chemotaxis protein
LQQAHALGINRYLQKPVKMRKLLQLMRELILGEKHSSIFVPDDETETAVKKEKPMTVLIAEDNVINQKIAIRMLEKMGHKVLAANNGQQAVEMYAKHNPHVVLMDIQMPVMDGYEATRLIREMEKKLAKHTPVLALTAHAMPGDREHCISKGMDDFITKPITFERLQETLNRNRPETDAE